MPRHLRLALAATALAALVPASASAAGARSAASDTSVARDIRRCVDVERKRLGLRTLRPSAALASAARLHARNMAQGRTGFDHEDAFGRGPAERVRKYSKEFRGVGENIASGQASGAAACRSWRGSKGHYANWTNRSYTAIGTGYASGRRGRMYVQVFAFR